MSKEISPDLSDNLYNLPNYILVGGEPFVMPGMVEFLEKLVDMKIAKDLRLNISTNLSLINKKMLKLHRKSNHPQPPCDNMQETPQNVGSFS